MNNTDFNRMLFPENEQPLDSFVTDGGFTGIFRTIGCVGDSLSSGEFEAVDADGTRHYYDYFDYSWGQYMARMAGCTARNFSRGGMTAREYCERFAEANGYWNPELACQAYIIALGVNDLLNERGALGEMSDIDFDDWRSNKKTFTGYYAQIVQRLKEIQPEARFFFVTIPRGNRLPEIEKLADDMQKRLYELAEAFPNSYVIDLRKYAPVYDAQFVERFFLHGHMNPCGYLLTARMMTSYIDYIIRHNMKDFCETGFIGARR